MLLIKQTIYMQMSAIKFTLPVFYCLLIIFSSSKTCLADSNFLQHFNTPPVLDKNIANRVTAYYSEDISLSLAQQKNELLKLESTLGRLENTYSRQPVYWFIKGLNHRNMASYYFESKDVKLADSQIYKKDMAYRKAIELDKASSNPLSAAIYNSMKHGLPTELKIQATQKELSLGGNIENDSAYWYLHWSNIDQLKKAGRNSEAEQAYKNMQQEMKEDEVDMSIYAALNKDIEKRTLQRNEKKPQISTNKPKTKPKAKTVEKTKPDKPVDKKFIIITSIVIFSILSLLFITIYEKWIKKRR